MIQLHFFVYLECGVSIADFSHIVPVLDICTVGLALLYHILVTLYYNYLCVLYLVALNSIIFYIFIFCVFGPFIVKCILNAQDTIRR